MSEEGTATSSVGPGARLAAAREAAGLTLAEAGERLHLDAATLQALEQERFATLGASVYVRGHLRRYAELLALPVGEIDSAYAQAAGAVPVMPDLRRVSTPLEHSATPTWSLSPAVVAAATVMVVLAALVWWALRMPHAGRGAAGGSTSAAVVAPVVVPAGQSQGEGEGEAGADPASNTGLASGAEAPADPVDRAHAAPSAQPASPPAATPEHSPPAPAAAGTVRLALHFREDSWAEIYDAAGARLLYELGTAGSDRHLNGNPPLRILLGNPGGVALELDGRPVALSGDTPSDSPLRLSLDGSGRILEVRSPAVAKPAPAPAAAAPR